MNLRLLPTAPVGSYPQPDWLIDRSQLLGHGPPRVRARDIWRIADEYLVAAQDDATIVAVRDMERAGLDIVTDGEIRRESYSNRFATALDGVDIDTPGEVINRMGGKTIVPRVVGPIRRTRPVQVRDVEFLRSITDRLIKMTVPGPFTMSVQVVDEHYGEEEALAMAYAEAVNEEVRDLFAAGADIVQLDEPWMQARPEQAKRFAVRAINRALEGAAGATAVHMCFGYANMVKDKTVIRFCPSWTPPPPTRYPLRRRSPGSTCRSSRRWGRKPLWSAFSIWMTRRPKRRRLSPGAFAPPWNMCRPSA